MREGKHCIVVERRGFIKTIKMFDDRDKYELCKAHVSREIGSQPNVNVTSKNINESMEKYIPCKLKDDANYDVFAVR